MRPKGSAGDKDMIYVSQIFYIGDLGVSVATHSTGMKSTQEAGPGVALTWLELQWGTGHMGRGQSTRTGGVVEQVNIHATNGGMNIKSKQAFTFFKGSLINARF